MNLYSWVTGSNSGRVQYFWRFGDSRRIENEKPIEISRFWYNLPYDLKSVDAVYERPKDRLIVFFVGQFIY